MFSWLKKHFIPHEGNEHRPHILRARSARNIAILIIFVEIFAFLIPILSRININGGMAAVLPAVLDDLTNNERQSQNLPTLAVSPLLNEAAQLKANDMATHGYFAHVSPSGKTPWDWLNQVGYDYQYAGENLAINFSDSQDVTNAWMASPAHRANIEKGNYTEVGTGIASGIYEGHQTIFVVQDYANPMPIQAETMPIKTKSENKTTVVATTPKTSANVLGAETEIQKPTFWQKLIASPRNSTNIIFYVIFAVIAIALLLYILIKTKLYHIDLLANGLIILAIIGAVLVGNYYLSHKNMAVSDSFDYSLGNQ